ncbi:MAG TPA: 3-methyl-2-oxobutanoate hydroxymethyltransferase [Burkholderiales bacterium]|nr:3-methyl-2-oxobutanoate hydroxymethyltransferase [Burkholderiales bacterium]
MDRVTVKALQEMKRQGRKIVAVVAWDTPTAQIADRAGVDMISVGDSVGVNLWGRSEEAPVTLAEMLIVCKAVRAGAKRALLSCDVPSGSVDDARRLVEEGGAEMVKVLASAERVRALVAARIPVFAEFHGQRPVAELVADAKALEAAGAAMLDFRHSGAEAGAAVAKAVSIPVIGGLGGGPWLDGRVRMAHAAIGYAASWVDSSADTYANTAKATLQALTELAADVRAGRQIRGQRG